MPLEAPEPPRAAAPAFSDGLDAPRRHWAAFGLILSIIVVVLDASMTNVALPSIARSLSVDPDQVVWVAMAYNLIVVVSLLPLSAVGERIGFKTVYVAGMIVVSLAGIAAALSSTLTMLIAARIFQGLGAAMLMCLFGGILRNIYPLRLLAFGIGLNSMSVGLVSVLGPAVGAVTLQFASWPWIFILPLPFAVASLFCVRFLPDIPRSSTRFDWLACLLGVPTFGLLLIGLDGLARYPVWAVPGLVVCALTGWLLLQRSRRQAAPLVPVDLLRLVPVAYAVTASLFTFGSQMASLVALPFYFQEQLGHNYSAVGLLLGAWALGMAAMAPAAGYLSNRVSVAVLCAVGAGLMAAGTGAVLLMSAHTPLLWVFSAMLASGIGFGLFQTPNNRAILSGGPKHRSGAVGGLQSITRVLGQSIGTALVAIAFSLAGADGAAFGVGVSVICALASVAINIFRYMNPAPDLPVGKPNSS